METLLIGGRVFDGVNTSSDETGVLIDGGVITRIAPAAEFESFQRKED